MGTGSRDPLGDADGPAVADTDTEDDDDEGGEGREPAASADASGGARDSSGDGGIPGSDEGSTGSEPAPGDDDSESGAPAEPEPAAPPNLLDDLEDGNARLVEVSGRYGLWFTYNDGTPGSSQMPAHDLPFFPAAGGANGSSFHAHTIATGFAGWGAGLGVDFDNHPAQTRRGYDISIYAGLTFWARGTGLTRVIIPTPATLPLAQEGGECDSACNDAHGIWLMLTEEWTEYTLDFDDVEQAGWGAPADFDPTRAIGIRFLNPVDPDFEIAVDELEFFD